MKTFFKFIIINLITLSFSVPSSNAQMCWNQAVTFLGNSSSYVSVPNSASLNITGSFTLEAWVNPANTTTARGIIAKGASLGTTLRYALRISGGRALVITNGTPRLFSKAATTIPLNAWTHLSATYNSSTNVFCIYINGVLDSISVVAGAATIASADSLFIGISGGSSGFNGKMDEVRVWNRELSASEVSRYFRTSLATSSGPYTGLILSMPFQKENAEGVIFTARDFSGNGNNGNPRNASALDQSFRPLQTITQNDNIEFDGVDDYIATYDTVFSNPGSRIFIDCWVYPTSSNQNCNIVSKGNQYAILLENGIFKFRMNGNIDQTLVPVPVNKWSRLTIKYDTMATFYVDGVFRETSPPMGSIPSSADSIFVGGFPGATGDFAGMIDEFRMFTEDFNRDEIYFSGFYSIEKSNVPPTIGPFVSYNFDGSLSDNAGGGGKVFQFRNDAKFSHTGGLDYKPVSPLNRNKTNTLPSGFFNSDLHYRLPLTGTSGSSYYTLPVHIDENIFDIDLSVAINHPDLSSISITIISPGNDSLMICNNLTTNTGDNSLITVFDDQADSSFAAGKYASFQTTMKPMNNMNAFFSGKKTLGNWRIRIGDNAAGNSGYVNCFGLRFNNKTDAEYSVKFTNFIQGFYNPVSDNTNIDTVKLYLRNLNSPYEIIDSCKRGFSTFGISLMSFANAMPATDYLLSVVHRNSVEVWSRSRFFIHKTMSLNFHQSVTSVFGNNLIQVDNSPVRFAMFGGDVNQDGIVDATDNGAIDNDASNFATGYMSTDLTGDDVVDASDAAIADNNAFNFVSVITP